MDIQKSVADLLNSGLTQAQLAALVPCSQSLISALLNGTRGSRASFRIVDKLTKLHRSRVELTQQQEIA
ncbi:helix-turn-helix domain-containing protein [Burkholderia sp. BCC1988]|uniref:helix-turn-helix domain-containing protein n=1 Tax=Burkholderia sp. BCC1988 TaxID=2817443 RepID=UPI0039F0B85A